jgi:hypothetical protein
LCMGRSGDQDTNVEPTVAKCYLGWEKCILSSHLCPFLRHSQV